MPLQLFARRWSQVPGRVQISTGIYFFLPAAILLLPLRWLLGWTFAVCIHELGHYLALRICEVPIFGLRLSPMGVTMETGDLERLEIIFCALAGPLFALLFTVLSPVLPCTAVCILFQSLYNLLPIYPLDGGRAMRAILSRFLSDRWVGWAEIGILSILALVFLRLFYILRLGIVPTLLILTIFAQKFLANWGNTRYNRGKNLF